MGWVAPVASVVGAGASVYSGIQSYKQGRLNRRQANADADEALRRARLNADEVVDQAYRDIAAQSAVLAGRGITNSASAEALRRRTRRMAERDANELMREGAYEANRLRLLGQASGMQGNASAFSSIGRGLASGARGIADYWGS